MADQFISRDAAEGDLLAAAAFLAENIKSAEGHAEAMKAIVPIYLEKGEVDLAAELANQIDEPFSRDKMLILVAERCAKDDDDEYALQLADAIEDDGMRGQALERIALAKVSNGQVETAAEYSAQMAHPDFVLAAIAVKQAEGGDEAAAAKTLESIEFPAAEVAAHLQIGSSFISSGDTAKACPAIERAVAAAGEIEHDEERIRALCDAGNLFIEAKRSDLAIETFELARGQAEQLDNVHRDVFFVNCALGFKVAGSEDLAERTLDLVIDKTEMASALLAFAREDWRADRKEDAVEGLEEAFEILRAQRDHEIRDSRARNALMTNVAVQMAGFAKVEMAVEIAQTNLDPQEEMSALTQIAQIQAIQDDDGGTRETLAMIAEDANRLFGLISVSDSYERAGKRETAIEFLNEAATFSDSVPQLASRSSALNELAQRFANYGDAARAREISDENLEIISKIKDESSQAAALAGLAVVYSAAGLEVNEDELTKVRTMLYRVN